MLVWFSCVAVCAGERGYAALIWRKAEELNPSPGQGFLRGINPLGAPAPHLPRKTGRVASRDQMEDNTLTTVQMSARPAKKQPTLSLSVFAPASGKHGWLGLQLLSSSYPAPQ